eukprot:1165144_1
MLSSDGRIPSKSDLDNLRGVNNMWSQQLEDFVRYKEYNIIVLDHLNQYRKHIEDVDIIHRFFGIPCDNMRLHNNTGPFIMNTTRQGSHWIPAVLCRATESNGSNNNNNPTLCVKLCLKYFDTFAKCIGFLDDEAFKTNILNSFLELRKKIGAIDPRKDDFWQTIGDDMNQVINDPEHWKRQAREYNINIVRGDEFGGDFLALQRNLAIQGNGRTIPFNLYMERFHAHEAKQMIEHIDRINKQIEKVVKALRKFAMKRGWSILTQMGNAVNEDSANADAMDEDDTDANDIDQ